MAVAEALITAEEYRVLPDNGQPTELVRGRIVPRNMPTTRHGYYCARIARLLGNFAEEKDLGRVISNDSGVVTERGPDTVRGPDVAYYSYARLPKGPIPDGYAPVSPELVFEVRSPGDRWSAILAKVSEFLNAGVLVVCVLDEQTHSLNVYRPDEAPHGLREDDEFSLPDLLPGFRIVVRRFFE
ncbi:MAG: Uma2 family endonuclease [Gemmataceae bacterium]|nr:Uma2 family endonuclease [Gemmataceae bacterium]